MSKMVSVRTGELAGPALSWAIESLEGSATLPVGQLQLAFCAEPVDSAQCDRLIAKYAVWVEPGHQFKWVADAVKTDPCDRVDGETRSIAVSRAVLVKAHGKTCSIPAELI